MAARKTHHEARFPIVAIGASAGGLEAFSDLLHALPESPGAAFIYVQHQEAGHSSLLTQILARQTPIPVKEVSGGEELRADTIFVAPAHSQAVVEGGVIHLTLDGKSPMPIDTLFRSLAADQGSRAIAVVLSGTASDGTLGARAIKDAGGIVLTQDERDVRRHAEKRGRFRLCRFRSPGGRNRKRDRAHRTTLRGFGRTA